MKTWLARQLTALYPMEWQQRYRAEFEYFLQSRPAGFLTILNVIGWTLRERVLTFRRFNMGKRQNAVSLMLYSLLAMTAAGMNFYWTVDDTPLAAAMNNHSRLSMSWNLIEAGFAIAFVVVVIAGFPACLQVCRRAFADRRRDVLLLIAIPPAAALLVLIWLIAGMIIAGGHWLPTPWDVTGRWTAPPAWPSLGMRWTLSMVSFSVMLASLIVIAASLRQVALRTDWESFRRKWFTVSSLLLAVSMGLMALGVFAWGLSAEQIAAADFHSQAGGIFGSTMFTSWIVSFIVFIAAVAMSAKAARLAFTLKRDSPAH